jgi:hypothetical protein
VSEQEVETLLEIHADVAGDNRYNRSDEYLALENKGTDIPELSRWTVTGESGTSYQFPTGLTLGSGDPVTLYTGAGGDTGTSLCGGSDRLVCWHRFPPLHMFHRSLLYY